VHGSVLLVVKINCTKVKQTATKLHKSPDETDRTLQMRDSDSDSTPLLRAIYSCVVSDTARPELLHHKHGTDYRRSWNRCDRRTCFVVIWEHFCFILSTDTKIRTDSVMHPRSSSRGRSTSASVTVYTHGIYLIRRRIKSTIL